MAIRKRAALSPRKSPVQARSAVAVEAIHEAAIQVLLGKGLKQVTTTRVAERAGVSVGTLYQYYPNIQSLLAMLLHLHLEEVVRVTVAACKSMHGETLSAMMPAVVETYIAAKTREPEIARAMHAISMDLNGADIVRKAFGRLADAVHEMLLTASDCRVKDVAVAAAIIISLQTGPLKALLENGASPKAVATLKRHLTLLCSRYLEALAD